MTNEEEFDLSLGVSEKLLDMMLEQTGGIAIRLALMELKYCRKINRMGTLLVEPKEMR